ncbi:MAG: Xaa-Pro peptidase family protein [Patescibacteria group bacterium]|jgi:Xaa-Pro aminopeptidase
MLQERVEKLRKILKEKDLDGFLISNFYNILYLTGFKTLTDNEREGWALVTAKNVYLFTDSRSTINNELLILKLITPEKGLIKHLNEIAEEEKIQKIGFEGDDLKVNELNRLKEFLINIELVSFERLIIKIREIKDELEISNIKTACGIADKCLEEIVKTIKIGISEKEIAFKIELWLKEKNHDLSFYPIVAIDKNSSIPHYDTRNGNNEKAKKNSIILIDYGAKFNNYHSDTTRMIFTGKPTDEMINTYDNLLTAQEKTIKQLNIDNNPVSVDQFCRKLISDQRLPIYQHSTGHGVGLQVHEYPKISFTSTDVLLPNQVVTVEPGIYLENKWGMRTEDTILIKENKPVEILTGFSKKMLIIND